MRAERNSRRTLGATVGIVLAFVVLGVIGLISRQFPGAHGCSDGANDPKPTARVVLVTDLDGYVEPCGCTSDPLGGIDRLAAHVAALRSDGVPTAVVVTGNVFFDEPHYAPSRVAQERLRAEAVVDVLNAIGVDVVRIGSADAAHVEELKALRERAKFVWWSGDASVSESKLIALGELQVGLISTHDGGPSLELAESARTLKASGADAVMALVVGARRDAAIAGEATGVDFVLLGGPHADDPIPPHRVGDAWVINAGRQGQGATDIRLFAGAKLSTWLDTSPWSIEERGREIDLEVMSLRSKLAAWKKLPNVSPKDLKLQRDRLDALRREREQLSAARAQVVQEQSRFEAEWIAFNRAAPRAEAISSRMAALDAQVNDHNRLALAGMQPPDAVEGQATFVGSATCATCHSDAYDWWKAHPHGRAYKTLVDRHKEYNLSCVGCHVTGYEKPGGSTVTHLLDGALENVGCENCHGPGSLHAANASSPMVRDPAESTCVGCHNQEHSDLFVFDAYRATLLVPGHGDPRAPAARP